MIKTYNDKIVDFQHKTKKKYQTFNYCLNSNQFSKHNIFNLCMFVFISQVL